MGAAEEMEIQMTDVTTADQHRAEAARHEQEAFDSFERCDTDGFLSQWAHQMVAGEERLAASIAERGGRSEFTALFDLEGNLVAAKLFEGKFGVCWALLSSDDPRSRFIGFVNRSRAATAEKRAAALAKKGYREGRVLAPAKAVLRGSGTGLASAHTVRPVAERTDGGFSRDVEIVSTGA